MNWRLKNLIQLPSIQNKAKPDSNSSNVWRKRPIQVQIIHLPALHLQKKCSLQNNHQSPAHRPESIAQNQSHFKINSNNSNQKQPPAPMDWNTRGQGESGGYQMLPLLPLHTVRKDEAELKIGVNGSIFIDIKTYFPETPVAPEEPKGRWGVKVKEVVSGGVGWCTAVLRWIFR